MSVFLPEPESGESLTSCITRYGRDLDVVDWPGFIQRLFGYKQSLNPAYGRNLNCVAEETKACWGMSSTEIARRLTLLPYLRAFYPEAFEKRLEAYIVGGIEHKRSMLARSIGRNRTLRYCPCCFNCDEAQGRPLYWRLLHQAPAVLACEKHDEWLREKKYGNNWWGRWPAPELSNSERTATFPGNPGLLWRSVSKLCGLAQMGQWNSQVAASPDGWSLALSEFYSLSSPCDRGELRREFCDAFGVRQLEKLGLRLAVANDWLFARIQGRAQSLAPFVDVLITAYCHSLMRGAPWPNWQPCVNVFAPHDRDHIAQWISNDTGKIRAACICGASSSFTL